MSTRDIADRFGVSDPTVIRWENGTRTPSLDQLPLLDALAGRPLGFVLRLAGYVSDDIDVVTAIMRDPTLDDVGKAHLVDTYRYSQQVAAPADEDEPTDAELATIVPDLDDAGEAEIWGLRLTDAQKRYELWLLRRRRAEQAGHERRRPKRQARQAG